MVDHRCWNAGDAVFRQWTRTRSWTQARQVRRVGDIDSDGRVEQHAPQMRCGSRAGRAKGYLGLVSGRRWWFVCPKTAKRVSKLYLPPGAVTFASRGAHRLAYKSQRETPFARACSRAFKARRRLGDHQSIGATIEKPPGMRWRTFDRLLEKVEAAEGMATRACW